MTPPITRCLVLACGNTLRSDDGVGPWLAAWAEERFAGDARVRVLSRQQWTPDLAEDVARAASVVFLDCALDAAPGEIRIRAAEPALHGPPLATHQLGASELLALGRELYDAAPAKALLFTVGGRSIELGESFSIPVLACLPEARRRLEATIVQLIADPLLTLPPL